MTIKEFTEKYKSTPLHLIPRDDIYEYVKNFDKEHPPITYCPGKIVDYSYIRKVSSR